MQNISAMESAKHDEKLKNGLTIGQVKAAKEVIAQVRFKRLCEELGIPYMTIVNVLRGRSPQIDLLVLVLDACKKKIAERNDVLASIPTTAA